MTATELLEKACIAWGASAEPSLSIKDLIPRRRLFYKGNELKTQINVEVITDLKAIKDIDAEMEIIGTITWTLMKEIVAIDAA